jgi:protein TonB
MDGGGSSVTTLLESKARPYGSKKGAVVSMVVHGALITGAVVASGKAVLPDREKLEEHSILFVAPPPPKVHTAPDPIPEEKKPPPAKQPRAEPPRVRMPTPPRQVATPTPRPQQVNVPAAPLIAPIKVPTSVPPVNLNALPTVADVPVPASDPGKLVRQAIGGSRESSDGDVETRRRGGLGSGASNRAYSENQVERAVSPTRPPNPRYPEALRSVNVEGEVVVQYIVDARGRVEPGSIKILSSAHNLFADAVRRALLEARYRPAEVGGNPVRQLVEQPFQFKLDR